MDAPTPRHLTRSHLRELRELHTRAGREAQGAFLIEGERQVTEAAGFPGCIREVIVSERLLEERPTILADLGVDRADWLAASEEYLGRLSLLATPPGICAVLRRREASGEAAAGQSAVVALDGIADPGNLGTILRTCDWFGISSVLVGADGADPYNEKVVRAAMGSLLRLDVTATADLAESLRGLQRAGYRILVADAAGEPAGNTSGDGRFCLVLGSEARGAGAAVRQLADARVAVAGSGRAESLNVAVAGGILLYLLTAS